jgi:hypothetical protein
MPAPPGRIRLIARDMSLSSRRVQDSFDAPTKSRSGFRRCLPNWLS